MSTQPLHPLGIRVALKETTTATLLLAIASLFLIVGSITLYLAPFPTSLTLTHIVVMLAGWHAAWLSAGWILRRRLTSFDTPMLPLVAMLTGWGLLMQARLAPALLTKQVLWLVLGVAVMCLVAIVPGMTRILRRYRYTLLTAGLILLGATLIFGVNPSGFGQRLWLGAFGIYLQPSEPLKLLLVVYLAAYLSDKRDIPQGSGQNHPMWMAVVGPMAAMVGLALLLLGWQQDLGAALIFYLTFVAMIYLACGNIWYVIASLFLFVPVAVAGHALSDRVALRVSIWLNPWAPEQADRAFQIRQSLFAFGAGGLAGQGFGQGRPALIPAVHTDFVFAAVAEEFGLIGGLALIILMIAFVYRGIRLAQRSDSIFETLLAGGIAALLGIQTWVIVGGNAKLIPITGVTLPFFSYGGSSMVTTLIATGLLINLSSPHPAPINLSLAPEPHQPLTVTAARLGQGLFLLLTTLALMSGVWSIARAGELKTYLTNPRYIIAESQIRRGAIQDRDQTILADIEVDEDGFVTRTYPVPEAAPVVGFATLAYGTVGIESVCEARLRGEIERTPWEAAQQELRHESPVGRNVRLTIDAELQQAAQELLEGYVGGAVLVDARTGEVLALASNPIYDPRTVAENWETLSEAPDSPFLNRVTQGLAQPGTLLQPFILSSAWQRNPDLAPAEPISRSVPLNGIYVTCRDVPAETTWQGALEMACPYPFVELARDMELTGLFDSFANWGFLDAPTFTLPTVAAEAPPEDLIDEALGQGNLLVTPLQMVGATAALGNDGVRPNLHLLAQPLAGCDEPLPGSEELVVSPEVAEEIRRALPQFDAAVGHLGISLAGPDRKQAWFVGLNSPDLPRYAVAVLIDQSLRAEDAADIGTQLLQRVLEN